VPLCRRALREFNRRAVQPIVPKPRLERDIKDSLVNQLKRFARRQEAIGGGWFFEDESEEAA
jgi:hypothetical protein